MNKLVKRFTAIIILLLILSFNIIYNPYKPLTRVEIVEQLSLAHEHAQEGKVMDAHQASDNVRKKYGL